MVSFLAAELASHPKKGADLLGLLILFVINSDLGRDDQRLFAPFLGNLLDMQKRCQCLRLWSPLSKDTGTILGRSQMRSLDTFSRRKSEVSTQAHTLVYISSHRLFGDEVTKHQMRTIYRSVQ